MLGGKQGQNRWSGKKWALVAGIVGLLLVGALGVCVFWLRPPVPTDSPALPSGPRGEQTTRRVWSRVSGGKRNRLASLPIAPQPCAAVKAQEIYRFIEGIDECMIPMSPEEITGELNDPFAVSVLRLNAGGKGLWPGSVPAFVKAVAAGQPSFEIHSYMLGEGSQVPASLVPVTGNRQFRYIVTWGAPGQTPGIFLSAVPPGLVGGTPPPFLQVISFDQNTGKYNYYQYVNNQDLGLSATDSTRTWSWAGNSRHATDPRTAARGCFSCHLNGSLNMKELTPPWNNWHSPQAVISPTVVTPEVVSDVLFEQKSGADKLQNIFQSAQTAYTIRWVGEHIKQGKVSAVPDLLRRLITTTTVNLASSQITSAGSDDVTGVPVDFFLPDSVLRNTAQIGLQYTVPALTIARPAYNAFVRGNNLALVNTFNNSGTPDYVQPGATQFAFFVPVPAFEDVKAIQQLIQQKVISAKFAACVLMVDYPNPVFSSVRTNLMRYATQIPTGTADGEDIPTRFARLVRAGVKAGDQPGPSPEQEFLRYWDSADWKQACQAELQQYLTKSGKRILSPDGAADYLRLSLSRGLQFSNFSPVCHLDEFDLLLPCATPSVGYLLMNPNATVGPQPAFACPRPQGFVSPCDSEVYRRWADGKH